MDAQQVITSHLEMYRNMSRDLGEDDPRVADAFRCLHDLVIVEIYFMKSIRCLLKDDEMAGFVIYVNDDIRKIVNSYNSRRIPFLTYLKQCMENRALNYIEERMRRLCIQSSFAEFQSYTMVAEEPSPEDLFLMKESEEEGRIARKLMYGMLRYICRQNSSRVRKLFIFLCTLMPFLSQNVIDRFCIELNCDAGQTQQIARHLCAIQDMENRSKSSKDHMSRMVDFHWAMILENEGRARITTRPDKPRANADFHRKKLSEALKGSLKAKMNVSYRTVGELLNMEPGTVALYVMHAKHILQKVINAIPTKRMLEHLKDGDIILPRFEPFREFGIRAIGIPA